MRRLLALLLLLVTVLVAPAAAAHGLRTRYVEIALVSATTATVALRDTGLVLEAEPGCAVRLGALAQVTCERGVAGTTLALRGLAADENVVVLLRDAAGSETTTVVSRARPLVTLPGRGTARAVAGRYVAIGVEHVLSGIDHVLLLLALFWGAWRAKRRVRALALTATTFTAAHSVSLAATTLGLVHVPSAPAEAAIAVSLVLVALDVGREGSAGGERLGLVALFGLVHGLGFAGALAEVGLPAGAVPTALVAFNVGVELAQALVLGLCFAAAALARLVRPRAELFGAMTVTAYAVGIAGTFLLLARTSLFFR